MGFTSPALAQASMITQTAGVFTSGIGSFFGAKSQQSSLDAQAGLAETNARIAEMGAQSALQQGQQQVGALTMRAGNIKASQRASMAANGIDIGEGNAGEVQASTDIMKEVDSNQIQANAVRSAWGYRTQATNYQNEALVKRATADGISPFGAAASTLLTGAGSVANSWYRLKKPGALDQQELAKQGAEDFTKGWTPSNYG
jgi:hypothetical protein